MKKYHAFCHRLSQASTYYTTHTYIWYHVTHTNNLFIIPGINILSGYVAAAAAAVYSYTIYSTIDSVGLQWGRATPAEVAKCMFHRIVQKTGRQYSMRYHLSNACAINIHLFVHIQWWYIHLNFQNLNIFIIFVDWILKHHCHRAIYFMIKRKSKNLVPIFLVHHCA